MTLIIQSIFGILFIAAAAIWVYISILDDFDSVRTKIYAIATGVLFLGIGIWCAWPLILLIGDWATGSNQLAGYVQSREAQDDANLASEARSFAWIAIALAIINIPGALMLAYFLRQDRPRALEPWIMLATVLPISGLVVAAKAQAWTGTTLPTSGFLAGIDASVSATGVAAFLTLWVTVWIGTIAARLFAALPMGPVAAFLTPVATMPYYYGYYQDYAWGWMTLLWFASVLLGFVVNAVREIENDEAAEGRNESAEALLSRVLSDTNASAIADYVLFLRPFRATGSLDTQGGDTPESLDLETVLARALRPRWLVGLGTSMERTVVGAGRIYFGDDEWWDNLRILAERAAGIVIIPSAHEGTLREIRWLHAKGLLSKCVFLMPPMPDDGGLHMSVFSSSPVAIRTSTAEDQSALWNAASRALRESPGIELPPYFARGAILGLDADGRITRIASLDLGSTLLKIRRLKRALVPLLEHASNEPGN